MELNYDKVDEYRRRHKRCKYCVWLKNESVLWDYGCSYLQYTCKAKDKVIHCPDGVPRPFCSCYELSGK